MKNSRKFLLALVLCVVGVVSQGITLQAAPANITSYVDADTVYVEWDETSGDPVADYDVELSLNGIDWFPSPYPTTSAPEFSFPRPATLVDFPLNVRITTVFVDTSTEGPIADLITIPAIEVDNSTQFTASTPQTVITDAERKAVDLDLWLDGTLGFMNRNGQTVSFSSNGGTIARIVADGNDILGTVTDPSIEIQNEVIQSDHAGGGPVYYDEANDRLLMFYHGEMHDPDPFDFYSFIGMAQSYDGGESFEDLGRIITPNIAIDSPARSQAVEMGGGSYIIHDGYFYVYFKDKLPTNEVVNVGVARAPVADVLAAADLGNVVAWQKYSNGSFSASALGGEPDNILPMMANAAWFDVAYSEALDKYIMVYSNDTATNWTVFITTSDDGVNWSQSEYLFDGAFTEEEAPYISIAAPNLTDGKSIPGNSFNVYRTVSSSTYDTGNRWDDALVQMFNVSFDIPEMQAPSEGTSDNEVVPNSDSAGILAETGQSQALLVATLIVFVVTSVIIVTRMHIRVGTKYSHKSCK